MKSATLKKFRADLKNFQTGNGTIRFAPDKPLPDELLKRLIKARIVENQT